MRVTRVAAGILVTLALAWALAVPAIAAVKLPVQLAADKAFIFAKHTCAHDSNCVRYGVTNCQRGSLHVVFCRIFAERSTEAQGKYSCTRLVRVVLSPVTYRVVVTGQGDWSCH